MKGRPIGSFAPRRVGEDGRLVRTRAPDKPERMSQRRENHDVEWSNRPRRAG